LLASSPAVRASATPVFRPVLEAAPLAPPGGDLSVTVTARTERTELGSRVLGFVALAVPLDRFAAPKTLGATVAADPGANAASESGDSPAPAPANGSPVDGEGEDVVEPALPAPLLARVARDAVGAALRAHDVPLRRSELEGFGARARFSATLPELRFRVLRSNDESLRLTPTLEDPERYTHDGGTDFVLEASATWKLNRLIFADEEIAVERLALEREKNAERLSQRVLARLFDWHRALSELAAASVPPKRRGLAELERLEAEVELDVLTGGWFGEVARRFSKPEPQRTAPGRDGSAGSSPRLTAREGSSRARQARHVGRCTERAHGPQAARRCAKGVSLTSRASSD
jgi:hypothetical protein